MINGLLLSHVCMVKVLNSRLDGREFHCRPLRLILGWVTVFGRANHLSISSNDPGQLNLLSSAGREMSIRQSAMTSCGWGVKAGIAYSTCVLYFT